jgi:hypothetical protein
MPPKKPSELKKQISEQNNAPAKQGHERTAEGKTVPTPTRGAFFGNLAKLARGAAKSSD